MSDCASRMANHHVATVPESFERAPIEVRAPIGERSVTPEHAAAARAKTAHRPSAPNLCIRNCRWIRPLTTTKSQPRTGHTREPDPTHNELKHTITRKKAIDLSTDREDPRTRGDPNPSPPSVHRQAPGGPHTSHRSGHHRYTPVLQHTFHRVCSPPLARRFGRPHRRANRAPCPARRRASSELSSRPTGAFMG